MADGSWFGRWGVNYIYGTWSALCALNAAGRRSATAPMVRKAADWLVAIQNDDGGWGEDCDSYKLDYRGYEPAPSTASQTAWALLGPDGGGRGRPSGRRARHRLSAADPGRRRPVARRTHYTGGGFPRVFYLRYHGYPKFFPLWALARYRNLKRANNRQRGVRHVMILPSPAWQREATHHRAAPASRPSRAAAISARLAAKLERRCRQARGIISIGIARRAGAGTAGPATGWWPTASIVAARRCRPIAAGPTAWSRACPSATAAGCSAATP